MNKRIISIITLTFTTVVWGLAFLFQKSGGDLLGPFTFNGARYTLAIISMIPLIRIFDKENEPQTVKSSYIHGLLCGIVLFLAAGFQQLGIKYTNYTGKAGFLTDMYILIVPLFTLIQGKKLAKNVIIGILSCVIGFYYLCIQQTSSINIGDFYLVLCAFFFAIQIIYIDYIGNKVTTIRFALGQYLATAILSWIFCLLYEDISFTNILNGYIPILYGCFGSIVVGYTLQIVAQKNLDSITASLIMSLESVFCAIFTCIFFKEIMSKASYFGCVLIFFGIIISQINFKAKN